MNALEQKTAVTVAAVAGALVLGMLVLNKAKSSLPDSASAAGEAIGAGVADVTTGAAAGFVNHAANAFGIPMQDDAQCIIDLTNGDTLRAMSTCRIGTFAQYLYDGTIPTKTP